MSTFRLSQEQLQVLEKYTACDIADALLKLKVPNAGFLPDLKLVAPPSTSIKNDVIIAPASTVVMASKTGGDTTALPKANIPAGKHWVDLTEPNTIVVITQPEGQKCAVLGGIMALRMKVLNAQGVIIWAKATSIVGAGAESKPHSIQVPLNINGTVINPGDVVFSDAMNGVVVIPQDQLTSVLELLPRLVEADDRVKDDVIRGVTVQEAFKKHRG
ncbi:hypothetical protein EG329_003592 [Mollisiaceae sp. DMI_Dod_QoI]|nr:hypothetical protein EG329_003592 [Helotiales sp. DMI_Dod_QoI]